ncbi:MAG: aspartate-alanine antiporter, partial [Candidatus Margulisbacteria bacterium]|nr:aspartate-alanine antiporter [Candidatus Margulisiibacteriota bacterium]
MVVTLMPMIIGYFFGRKILKINPILLMGALNGAETATPSLNALKESSGSSVVALGFAVPYAIGNVVLTVWGTVIVNVIWSILK